MSSSLTRALLLVIAGVTASCQPCSAPAQILERLEEVDNGVLLGDLNFSDCEEPETGTLGDRVVDPWLER